MPSIHRREFVTPTPTSPKPEAKVAETSPAPAPLLSADPAQELVQARQQSQVAVSEQARNGQLTSPSPSPAPPAEAAESGPPQTIRRLAGTLGTSATLPVNSRFVRLDVQVLKSRLKLQLEKHSPEHLLRLGAVHQQGQTLIQSLRSATSVTAPSPPAPAVPPPAPVQATGTQPPTWQALQPILQTSLSRPDTPPKVFDSLEAAVEYANQKSSGAELIAEITGPDGQTQYAVISLKPGQKATAVQAALAELSPPLARSYLTDSDGWLTPLKPAEESPEARYGRVQELADVALNDKARGLDRNRAGNWDRNRGAAYQKNMLMVHAEIHQTQAVLQEQKSGLETQLQALKRQGQGDSPEAQNLRQQLQHVGQKLGSLGTARLVLEARLAQQPVSNQSIPDTELTIGQDRKQPERIQARLQAAVNHFESRLLVASPAEQPALEAQKSQLVNEMANISQRQLENQSAELSYRIRAGSLATIGKGLDQTRGRLEANIAKLETLETRIAGLKGDELKAVQNELNLVKLQIDKDRKDLIQLMKAEIKVFEGHANLKERGAKAAVELLNLQVKKLEALGSLNPARTLELVKETQSQLLATIQEAGDKFAGIRPSEAKALVQVSKETDAYIADYQVAKKQLGSLQDEVHHKAQLLQTPPTNSVGRQQLTAMEKAYVSKIQTKLKDAPAGSDLEQLKKLYIALEMKNNPDLPEKLRNRIDEDKIKAQIQDLSTKPSVLKAFDEARQEAVKEVFGKHDAVKELANHILSPAFQEYLSLLPEEQQAEILKAELGKLNFLNPAKAAEVQKALAGQQLQSKSVTILKNTSFEERKSAFEKAFGLINDPLNAADKSAKAADGLAKAIEKLSPEEMKKLEDLIAEEGRNPNRKEKLYKFLASKLPAHSPALDKLGQLHASGKIGGFMTLVASIATTGKVPDALAKGDFKSLADLSSSVLSVVGGAKGVADMFGFSKAVEAAQNLPLEAGMRELNHASRLAQASKALKVMEFLGPVGDTLTLGLDAYGSYQDFSNGDYVGGGAKAMSAAAGGAGAVAGVMILAGATGPGAPLVLAGATVVGLVAWGIDAAFGESDQETFLRQLGVLKPAPKPTPDPAMVERGRRLHENPHLGPKY